MQDHTQASTSRDCEVDGIRLHYHEAGKGPPLVLLHGGGPGASGWSNFRQNVPRLAAHFRVLLVDQPGYGGSDKVVPPGDEPRSAYAARMVAQLLEQLDIQKAHIVGNSLGGRTALTMALRTPEVVDRLILMGPGGGHLPVLSPWPAEGYKVLSKFYEPPGPSLERMQALVDVMMFDPRKAPPELAQERFEAAMAPDAREFFQRYFTVPGTHEPPLWKELDRVPHRTLIIWGRDDRVLPLDGALAMLKLMPDARLHVLPRCGHWAQLEQQAEFEQLLIGFLELP